MADEEKKKLNFYQLYGQVDSLCKSIEDENDYVKSYRFLDMISNIFIPEEYLELGLEGIEDLVADISNRKTILSKLYRASIRKISSKKIGFKSKKAELKIRTEDLMVNDPDVKEQKSSDKRQAAASDKLKNLQEEISSMESESLESQAFFDCVSHTYNDLSDKKETVSRQFSIIQEEINLQLLSAEDLVGKRRKIKK